MTQPFPKLRLSRDAKPNNHSLKPQELINKALYKTVAALKQKVAALVKSLSFLLLLLVVVVVVVFCHPLGTTASALRGHNGHEVD